MNVVSSFLQIFAFVLLFAFSGDFFTFEMIVRNPLFGSNTLSCFVPISSTFGSVSLQAPVLAFHQPFVVSPGFSPVTTKLVSQITTGKFVELSGLLSSIIVLQEAELQLVLTFTLKKPKWWIEISCWLEVFGGICFNISCWFRGLIASWPASIECSVNMRLQQS